MKWIPILALTILVGCTQTEPEAAPSDQTTSTSADSSSTSTSTTSSSTTSPPTTTVTPTTTEIVTTTTASATLDPYDQFRSYLLVGGISDVGLIEASDDQIDGLAVATCELFESQDDVTLLPLMVQMIGEGAGLHGDDPLIVTAAALTAFCPEQADRVQEADFGQ